MVQHLFLSPLDPTATPFVPTFPHPPMGTEYSAMLAIVGLVMAAAAVVLYRGGVSRNSRSPHRVENDVHGSPMTDQPGS